jgi:hypothetical protein
VYLLRVVRLPELLNPRANIPRVELPAADPRREATLEEAAEPFTSVANVYLSRVASVVQLQLAPKENIPIVPGAKATFPANPNPWAENAPLVEIIGIYLNCVTAAITV